MVVKQFSGAFYLDYNGIPQYKGDIPRAILRENQLVAQFTGHDADEGAFSGEITLLKTGSGFEGDAYFRTSHGQTEATIRVRAEVSPADLVCEGLWQDEGDAEPYLFSMELQPIG